MDEIPKTALTEDVLTEPFGFRVKWLYSEYSAGVEVWEIVARDGVDDRPLFQRKESNHEPDCVEAADEGAERYLKGFIKWDGCSEFKFAPDREECMYGDFHWCGPNDYRRHFALLELLYRRAQVLIVNGNNDPWDTLG